jgi:hypothetical protein
MSINMVTTVSSNPASAKEQDINFDLNIDNGAHACCALEPQSLTNFEVDFFCKSPTASKNCLKETPSRQSLPVRLRRAIFGADDNDSSPPKIELSTTFDDDSSCGSCFSDTGEAFSSSFQNMMLDTDSFCKTPPVTRRDIEEPPPMPSVKRRRVELEFEGDEDSFSCPPPIFNLKREVNRDTSPHLFIPQHLLDMFPLGSDKEMETQPFRIEPRLRLERGTHHEKNKPLSCTAATSQIPEFFIM